jgi:hypothetical protein
MNDFDLEAKIRSLRAPQREQEYWEQFPDRILRETRRVPPQSRVASFLPELLWGARMAVACLALGFCLWQSGLPKNFSRALVRDEKELRRSVERLHANLGRLMQDEHGLHRLVDEQS